MQRHGVRARLHGAADVAARERAALAHEGGEVNFAA
jgi:hypothetical protein